MNYHNQHYDKTPIPGVNSSSNNAYPAANESFQPPFSGMPRVPMPPYPPPSVPPNMFYPMNFNVPPPNFIPQTASVPGPSSNFNQFLSTPPPPIAQNSSNYHADKHWSSNEPNKWRESSQSSHKSSKFYHQHSKPRERDYPGNSRMRSRDDDRDRHRERTWKSRQDFDRHNERGSSVKRNNFPPSHSRKEHRDSYYKSERHESRSRSVSSNRTSPPPSHREESRKPIEIKSNREEGKTERARILEKWRSNFCETSEDITRKLEELSEDNEKECWVRSSPADLYYKRTSLNEMEGTSRLEALCTLFQNELVDRGQRARQLKPNVEVPTKRRPPRVCRHKSKILVDKLKKSRCYRDFNLFFR